MYVHLTLGPVAPVAPGAPVLGGVVFVMATVAVIDGMRRLGGQLTAAEVVWSPGDEEELAENDRNIIEGMQLQTS